MYKYSTRPVMEDTEMRERYYPAVSILLSEEPSSKPDALAEYVLSVNESTRGSIVDYIHHKTKTVPLGFLVTNLLKETVNILTDCDHTPNLTSFDVVIDSNNKYDIMYMNSKITIVKKEITYILNNGVCNELAVLMKIIGLERTIGLTDILIDLEHAG